MVKRTFFCIIAIGLLLAGCVKIPDRHSTVGKYNELGDINTECLWNDSILPANAPAAPQQIDELNSRSFRVLNWNSYKGSKKGWQEDFERLTSQSDLVVLQEGYLTGDLQELLNKKQYSWDIAKAFTYHDIDTGVLTASRVKPDFLCSFRVPEPLSGIPKTVLITRYPLSGTDESLLVANIHMVNFSLDLSAYRAQLEKTVEVVSQHRGPLIIAGDFNSWNTERLRILTDIMQELGARAVTFETDHRVRFMGQLVDHIFYRKLVPLEALTEKVTTSDHNPMLVTFRLADDV
ncbi:MAG: endonuclease/exonuclease/phosphatase family protein [Proteobacteria bacterium]|nr:endonuclease/exonuclease/phosphatase family protein [Pseudomonadota bacterium]